MAQQAHGKVTIARPGGKPRTIAATLWNLPDSPFKKQGYKLLAEVKPPIGVDTAKRPGKKPAKAQDVEVEEIEQPEINVSEE